MLTKSYHRGILNLPLEEEVIHIGNSLLPEDFEKARSFLTRIKPLLLTKECVFKQSEKNALFDRCHPLTHEQRVDIIKTLVAEDCVKIEPNNNPRYADSEVYAFIKTLPLTSYGEEELVTLYIKMYLNEQKHYDIVIVISFHPEGMHD